MSLDKPTLWLDVDGVLNCCIGYLAEDPLDRDLAVHEAIDDEGRSWILRIDPRTPAWLTQLRDVYDIVWATTWRNANEVISPLVGLPDDLDQVWFPIDFIGVPPDLCRKTQCVRHWAASRGVSRAAWIDDEITSLDQEALLKTWEPRRDAPSWYEALVSTPPLRHALTVPTDSRAGLTETNVWVLLQWAAFPGDPDEPRHDGV